MIMRTSRASYSTNSVTPTATTVSTVRTMRRVKSWSLTVPPACVLTPGEVLSREVRHQSVDDGEFLGRCEEDNAEETVFRAHPEARAVDAEDAGRAQQPQHVVFVGAARWQLHFRHDVEAGDGGDARHARHRRQAFDGQRGARPQLRAEDRLVRSIAEQGLRYGELHR